MIDFIKKNQFNHRLVGLGASHPSRLLILGQSPVEIHVTSCLPRGFLSLRCFAASSKIKVGDGEPDSQRDSWVRSGNSPAVRNHSRHQSRRLHLILPEEVSPQIILVSCFSFHLFSTSLNMPAFLKLWNDLKVGRAYLLITKQITLILFMP